MYLMDYGYFNVLQWFDLECQLMFRLLVVNILY
jgi:hypothetical protein